MFISWLRIYKSVSLIRNRKAFCQNALKFLLSLQDSLHLDCNFIFFKQILRWQIDVENTSLHFSEYIIHINWISPYISILDINILVTILGTYVKEKSIRYLRVGWRKYAVMTYLNVLLRCSFGKIGGTIENLRRANKLTLHITSACAVKGLMFS